MDGEREVRDFIRFIQDAAINENLAVEFLSINKVDELIDFFKKHEYDVEEPDCKDILFARKRMEGLTIPVNTGRGLVKIGFSGEMFPMRGEKGPFGKEFPPGGRWPWPCKPDQAY